MNNSVTKLIVVGLLFALSVINTAWADEAQLNKRIESLERIVKGQGLVSLMSRVEQLQSEVQRLNGDNETLRHQLNEMKRRQSEMSIAFDGRYQPVTIAASSENKAQPVEAASDSAIAELEKIAQPEEETVEKTEQPKVGAEVVESEVPIDSSASLMALENGDAAYQSAYQTLRGGQYKEAIIALSAFSEQYPQSSYLPNAYYWQGEANYVLRNFEGAIKDFEVVIEQFPVSNKVAGAILKKGFSQYELGQVDMAKANLAKVIELYPATSSARLAKVRLDRIGKETR
jgi:tol-pal system protein YbgF|tara:strand:- start:2641 stop:3501 length:861 start_codon:yes stop_codon:yes gene_type:complete